MTRPLLAAWFALVLALALFSRWYVTGRGAERCNLDGGRIAPIYRVDLALDGAVIASFCCVRCASEWPSVPPGARWRVRDEITGEVLDSEKAGYVESSVVTVPARQDHTHVFEHWADASGHIAEYGGERVANPLIPAPSDEDEAEPNQ